VGRVFVDSGSPYPPVPGMIDEGRSVMGPESSPAPVIRAGGGADQYPFVTRFGGCSPRAKAAICSAATL
jgi:hypothetical protein